MISAGVQDVVQYFSFLSYIATPCNRF